MTPVRRRNFILGFLAVLGVIAGLLFLSRPATPTPMLVDPRLTVPGKIAQADLAADPLGASTPVPLERPAPGHFDAGLRPIANLGADTGPIDRRDNPGPNAGRQTEIIRYAFETLEDDVQACLQQWESSAPGDAAQVMIGFEIDANGLQKSWLEHETEVPFGPRTCLANAVYGLDWSHIVDHPAKLTQRFELGRKDAR